MNGMGIAQKSISLMLRGDILRQKQMKDHSDELITKCMVQGYHHGESGATLTTLHFLCNLHMRLISQSVALNQI